jgi:hypothetical protein
VEKLISDSRPRHWGRLPPVVERALSLYACHGRDGSGIARRREGFWFRVQRSEGRGQKSPINKSGIEREHEHENEHEHEHEDEGPKIYNCVSLSERQAGALALQRDFRSSILSYSMLLAPCSAPHASCPLPPALRFSSRPSDKAELVVLL